MTVFTVTCHEALLTSHRSTWISSFLLLLVLGHARTAGAQPIHLSSLSPSIEIVGIAEGISSTFKSGSMLFSDADVSLTPIPSVLKEQGGSREIPIVGIRINNDAPFTLQKNIPRLLTISVDTTFLKGKFCGDLRFLGQPDSSEALLILPICLSVSPKANIMTVPALLNFKLTRCGFVLACGLAKLLVTDSQTDRALRWQLVDRAFSGASPVVADMTTLYGDKSHDFVSVPIGLWSKERGVTQLGGALALPSLDSRGLALAFYLPTELRADHYQGQAQTTIQNGVISLIPVSIDVRDGPLVAISVLVFGIVLGRLIQASNSARSQSQTRMLDRYNGVSSAVNNIDDTANRRFLDINLESSRADIRLMARSEVDIINDLDLLDKLAADAAKLDMWSDQIANESDPTLRQNMQAALAAARAAINLKNLAVADTHIAEIIVLLGQSAGAHQLAAAASAATLTVPAGRSAALRVATPARPGHQVVGVLSWLSGAEPVGEAWYYYVRPLLYLLLLLLLTLVGLYNLYIRNPVFGSDSLFDYLGLFMWGFSADVAQKSLQQLSLTSSR